MALKQNEARELKAKVMDDLQKLLIENGYYCERIESGLAIAVDKDGGKVTADFEKEAFFFVANPTYKKEFDLDEELENYEKKLKKDSEKASGTGKAKVSAKDLDVSTMTAEELKELEERLAKAKGTAQKPESLKTKEDKAKEKAEKKKALDKAIAEGVAQAQAEEKATEEPKTETAK